MVLTDAEKKARARKRDKEYRDKPENKARKKERDQSPEYRAKDKARRDKPENKAREKARRALPENKAKDKEYQARYEVRVKHRKHQAKPENRAKAREYQSRPEIKAREKENRDYQRSQVLQYYSKHLTKSNIPCCNCCGVDIKDFLALDHIAGKKQMDSEPELVKLGYSSKKSGRVLINWIIDNGFPDGFQILCHNCNYAKGMRKNKNVCPHQQ